MVEEKIYTINLRQKFRGVPNYQKTKVAVRATKEFLVRHVKKDKVLLGKYLNNKLHERGRKNPPHKVQVRVWEDKEKWKAELVGAPIEKPKEEEKKKPAEPAIAAKEQSEKKTFTEKEKEQILEKPDEKKEKPLKDEGKKTVKKAGEQTRKAGIFSKTQKPTHEKKK